MLKGSDTIGLPVVTFDTGEQIEKITDVVFNHESGQVVGFLVDEGGWFSAARVVPFDSVQTVGPDALVVPSKSAVVDASGTPEVARILKRDNVLKGTTIMTTDGRDLGSMRDLYYDEATGRIEGFEVSGGLFADAYEGRSFVPAPQTINIGEDVAFVPPETADLMKEQVGGIKGAAQSLGEKIKEGAEAAGDKVQEGAQVVGEKIQSGTAAAGEKLKAGAEAARGGLEKAGGAASGTLLEEARGKRVREPVRDRNGYFLAAPGQIVTDHVIERARSNNQEQALLAAVGLSTGEAASAKVKGAASSAGSGLKEGAADLKEGAANLWDKVKEKVGDAKDRSKQELEERRIRGALGRPVTRVILDKQDNVILNVGELITHAAIEQARVGGELEVLLDSVYKGEPDITQEELRADESGSAALESEPDEAKPAAGKKASTKS
jgi:uncharacterized protein YrrD